MYACTLFTSTAPHTIKTTQRQHRHRHTYANTGYHADATLRRNFNAHIASREEQSASMYNGTLPTLGSIAAVSASVASLADVTRQTTTNDGWSFACRLLRVSRAQDSVLQNQRQQQQYKHTLTVYKHTHTRAL